MRVTFQHVITGSGISCKGENSMGTVLDMAYGRFLERKINLCSR